MEKETYARQWDKHFHITLWNCRGVEQTGYLYQNEYYVRKQLKQRNIFKNIYYKINTYTSASIKLKTTTECIHTNITIKTYN